MNYIKYLSVFFVTLYFWSTVSYAVPEDNLQCRDKVFASYLNLEQADFSEKNYIKTQLDSLLSSTAKDAYLLSMPLLISGELGNKDLYASSLNQMNQAMDQMPSNPLKAWLYGRMLLAAHSIGDTETVTKVQSTLKTLLEQLNQDDSTRQDRFTVWALGYIAALDKSEFDVAKNRMMEGADNLTKEFFKVNSSSVSEEKKQEARSDALWAWVMISQAAANAHEKDHYEQAIKQMLLITQQSSLGDALTKGLLRTAASNDYPAWAISIVRLAAQTMGDKTQYDDLLAPLNASISGAKNENKVQETLLAMVNAYLALERQNKIDQCPEGK